MQGKFGDFFKESALNNASGAESLDKLNSLDRLKLKSLKSRFLDQFWEARPNKDDMYMIGFEKSIISEIDFDSVEMSLDGEISEKLKTYNYIDVDEKFSIKSTEYIMGSLHTPMIGNSFPDRVIFYFGPQGIDTCIDGRHIDKINVFYSEEELASFAKRYLITDIDKVLDLYQNTKLNSPASYALFFAHLSTINKIDSKHHKNVLRNKPEHYFRDHLQTFLNENTRHDFYKELELPSKRETDLFTEWEGKKYLIEIKWLGMCVDKDGVKFTQPITDFEARDGVVQSLKYIKELIESVRFNLKCGYLLVFDAREEKKEINYKNFDNVTEELMPFFKYNFRLLKKLDVTNIHPS